MDEEKRQLAEACEKTIEILNFCKRSSPSKIIKDKIDVSLLEIDKLKEELKSPGLDSQKYEFISSRLTSMGKDLITYGNLILPPDEKN